MGRLEEMAQELQDLPYEDLMARVREIRAERRVTKEGPRAARKKATKKSNTKKDLKALLKGMSAEELKELLSD